jgi:hypothetical protein
MAGERGHGLSRWQKFHTVTTETSPVSILVGELMPKEFFLRWAARTFCTPDGRWVWV